MTAKTSPCAPRIGVHAPIAGGLQHALIKAHERNLDVLRAFVRGAAVA